MLLKPVSNLDKDTNVNIGNFHKSKYSNELIAPSLHEFLKNKNVLHCEWSYRELFETKLYVSLQNYNLL